MGVRQYINEGQKLRSVVVQVRGGTVKPTWARLREVGTGAKSKKTSRLRVGTGRATQLAHNLGLLDSWLEEKAPRRRRTRMPRGGIIVVNLKPSELEAISELPFVESVRPNRKYRAPISSAEAKKR